MSGLDARARKVVFVILQCVRACIGGIKRRARICFGKFWILCPVYKYIQRGNTLFAAFIQIANSNWLFTHTYVNDCVVSTKYVYIWCNHSLIQSSHIRDCWHIRVKQSTRIKCVYVVYIYLLCSNWCSVYDEVYIPIYRLYFCYEIIVYLWCIYSLYTFEFEYMPIYICKLHVSWSW